MRAISPISATAKTAPYNFEPVGNQVENADPGSWPNVMRGEKLPSWWACVNPAGITLEIGREV